MNLSQLYQDVEVVDTMLETIQDTVLKFQVSLLCCWYGHAHAVIYAWIEVRRNIKLSINCFVFSQKNLSSVNQQMQELHDKCLGIDSKGTRVDTAIRMYNPYIHALARLHTVENRGAVRFQIRNFMRNVGVSPAMRKSLQSTPVDITIWLYI